MALVSMTGFGTATFDAGGSRHACQPRSVNRRVLEVTVRLPPELAALEPALRSLAAEVCVRGEVVIAVDRDRSPIAVRAEVDEAAARALDEACRRVLAAVGRHGEVPLEVLLTSPDVVRLVRGDDQAATDECRRAVLEGARAALADLDAMRRREGEALERDVMGRVEAVRGLVARVRAEEPAATAPLKERAIARARMLGDAAGVDLDPASLANAVVGLADKCDISEELARLDAHLERFGETLASPPPHGRRLDFLCQELLRELGTLSAKAASSGISHLAVDARSEVERVREQVANVL